MVIVVGAGFSGAVIAERFANQMDERVLVIERREHIGGNCYDFVNSDGILVPLYGPHFFHTKDDDVWKYVQSFSTWVPYEHRVLSYVDGQYVPIPVNITTVNRIFHQALQSEADMERWLNDNVKEIPDPKNSEESALSRVGPVLYEKMFRNYTKKQWDMYPHQLAAQVMNRIPVRRSFDDRYFDDPYQALPAEGYTSLFRQMLSNPNIEIRLGVDYFDIKDHLPEARYLFFTGRIDHFFRDHISESLSYRSLNFEFETLNQEYFLPSTTVNYPNDHDYTRITEPKRATGQRNEKTTIIREYPTWDGEPYYPVLNSETERIFQRYQVLSAQAERDGVRFVGRLANYKYFNMDQAIKNALGLFRQTAVERE